MNTVSLGATMYDIDVAVDRKLSAVIAMERFGHEVYQRHNEHDATVEILNKHGIPLMKFFQEEIQMSIGPTAFERMMHPIPHYEGPQ